MEGSKIFASIGGKVNIVRREGIATPQARLASKKGDCRGARAPRIKKLGLPRRKSGSQ